MPAQSQPDRSPTDPPLREVLDAGEVTRALTRISYEILERTNGAEDLVLLGIPRRGVPLARRLAARLSETEGFNVPVG
ncbi:MAG: phosphoribosyltransferase family protein, partial [Candidatus Nanopelagicales bacterium]